MELTIFNAVISTLIAAGIAAVIKLQMDVVRLQSWKELHEKFIAEKLDNMSTNITDIKQLFFLSMGVKPRSPNQEMLKRLLAGEEKE